MDYTSRSTSLGFSMFSRAGIIAHHHVASSVPARLPAPAPPVHGMHIMRCIPCFASAATTLLCAEMCCVICAVQLPLWLCTYEWRVHCGGARVAA